jgi:hypothetical protein
VAPYFDYSHLGLGPGGGSYRESINDVGDALTEVMKRRAERDKIQQSQAQHEADKRMAADQFNIVNQRERDRMSQTTANEQAIRDQAQRQFAAEGAGKVMEAFKAGGPEAAGPAGAAYGITLNPHPDETPPAPVAPEQPQTPDRNEVPAVGPLAFMPPELRAMLGRANQRIGEVGPPPEAPAAPEAGGATAPPPFDPTAPPKAGPAPPDMRAFAGQVAAYQGKQQAAGELGMQEQGQQELEAAKKAEAFPSAQAKYEQESATYPQRVADASRARGYDMVLPGGKPGGTLSTASLVDQPAQQAADRFRSSQEALLQQKEQQAKALIAAGGPPEAAARRRAQGQAMLADVADQRQNLARVAASVAGGGEKPAEAGKAFEATVQGGQKTAEQAARDAQYRVPASEQIRLREAAIQAALANAAAGRKIQDAGVDVKKINSYQGVIREVKSAAMEKVDVTSMREANDLASQLKNPNGPQTQLMIDKLIKGAVGGRAAVQLVQNVRNSLGPIVSAQIPIYQMMHNGEYPPIVINAYRKMATEMAATHNQQAVNTARAIESKVGLNSTWGQDPEMVPRVVDEMRATYTALGLPIPGEYGGEQRAPAGGVQLPARPAPAGASAGSPTSEDDILKEIRDL